MKQYILSCCSTADLTDEHLKSRNISYVCFSYELNGQIYKDDMGKTISMEEFYESMAKGAETKTSQINAEEFIEYFEPFLKDGYDIFHVCLSSGLTGVISSANIARTELLERYPDRKIYIMDSLAASSGFGLLMDKLADLRDSGMSMEELADWFDKNKLKVHHWFFSTDLSYYIKGGRISKTAGTIGSLLNICPLLNMNKDGKLVTRFKIRGKKKVIHAIVDQMKEHAENGVNYSGKCYICHSACYEDARKVADLVEESFPKIDGKVEIYNIGTVIGSHTGPGTVALFFFGSPRVD